MKTEFSDSTLGIMRLFNNEEYYKYSVEVFSSLNASALKCGIEYIDEKGRLGYRTDHPYFWIAQTANTMVGYLYIEHYHYVKVGTPHWWISKHRENGINFLSMKEVKQISSILNNDELLKNLYKLMALSEHLVNTLSINPRSSFSSSSVNPYTLPNAEGFSIFKPYFTPPAVSLWVKWR